MSETKPTCPFCGEDWSDEMLAEYDRLSEGSACACSMHGQSHVHREEQPAEGPPIPTEDLCCASCGRALFRAPVLMD